LNCDDPGMGKSLTSQGALFIDQSNYGVSASQKATMSPDLPLSGDRKNVYGLSVESLRPVLKNRLPSGSWIFSTTPLL
jgi:hypothetical protein